MKIDGQNIVENDEKYEKLLGINIQSNLKWGAHLNKLKSRLKIRLAGLYKLRFMVLEKNLKLIVQGLFNSNLMYCLPLFGGCDKMEINSLQLLQNKAANIVGRFPPRSHRSSIFDKLGWLTINQLIVYHSLVTVYKIRQRRTPEYLATIFRKENIRGKVMLPKLNLELAEKCFSFGDNF